MSEYDNTVAAPSEALTSTPAPVAADPHNHLGREGEVQQPNTTPLAEELREAHQIPAAGMPERQNVIAQEERIEYRDQDGNILNEEQVKALEGKVEFHTRYETRTRLLDEAGNEVPVESSGVAGPLVDGANPETPKVEPLESGLPPRVDAETESEVDAEKRRAEASPASDGLHET